MRRARHPRETLAQGRLTRAIAKGVLPRPTTCESCGARPSPVCRVRKGVAGVLNRVSYHHHSYEESHELDVIPLCEPCHRRVHGGNFPEPRTGRVYGRRAGRRCSTTASKSCETVTEAHELAQWFILIGWSVEVTPNAGRFDLLAYPRRTKPWSGFPNGRLLGVDIPVARHFFVDERNPWPSLRAEVA